MDDIKLLPLPKWMGTFIVPDEGKEVGCDHRLSALMKDYARANVAHATAAKDAEIAELLDDRDDLLARLDASIDHGTKLGAAMQRCLDEVLEQEAEIERLQAEVDRLEEIVGGPVQTYDMLKARAERLAEALQMIAGTMPCPDNLMGNVDIAIAALRDLDQEGGEP